MKTHLPRQADVMLNKEIEKRGGRNSVRNEFRLPLFQLFLIDDLPVNHGQYALCFFQLFGTGI